MKRHGNLFKKIIDPDNIYNAYINARKGKSWQDTVKNFEKNLEVNLQNIRQSLIDKTFSTAEYSKKTIYEPKERIIYILPFSPDRIIQHALMAVLIPIWDPLFIHDSYSCRKGKGMHRASQKVMKHIKHGGFCLYCDISKFYPSIDHEILFEIIKQKIKCKDTLWLIDNIIRSFPGGKNTPIGNFTSQWFGNIYMNELDQWLKHEHKVKNYLRYCDDFIIFHDDKAYLHKLKEAIEQYLYNNLKLTFSKWSIYPVSKGVEFVGYRHFKNHILLRKSTTKRIKKRIKALPYKLKTKTINLDQFRSSIASTEGWMKWANTYNLSLKLEISEIKKEYGWS